MDVLGQDIGENRRTVVAGAGAGLLDAAGLVLDLLGADDLHVCALDLRLGLDLLRAEQLFYLSVHGDERLPGGAVEGVSFQQKTHIVSPPQLTVTVM